MTALRRTLRLDRERWAAVDEESLWAGTAVVVVASFLLALTRLGGLSATEPRSFLRLGLVGVWGWLVLSLVLWVLGCAATRWRRESDGSPGVASLRRTAAVAGLAHVPLLVGAVVVFVTAVLLRWTGPGTLVAGFIAFVWIPASLVVGARELFVVGPATATAVAIPPYAAWLAVVGRHLHQQVGHLL